MNPTYQPTSIVQAIIALIFYILMAGLVLYSLLAIYALLQYGRTKILSIVVSLLYLIIAAGLYAAAVGNLNSLKL